MSIKKRIHDVWYSTPTWRMYRWTAFVGGLLFLAVLWPLFSYGDSGQATAAVVPHPFITALIVALMFATFVLIGGLRDQLAGRMASRRKNEVDV